MLRKFTIPSLFLVFVLASLAHAQEKSWEESLCPGHPACAPVPGSWCDCEHGDISCPCCKERGAREGNEGEESFETERDAFTPQTNTIGQGRFALESTYSFIDNRDTKDKHSFPELLIRYGFTERVEVRLGWNYEAGGGGMAGMETEDFVSSGSFVGSGEQTLLYGGKFNLSRQKDWIPESSLILQGNTPTGGEANDSKFQLGYVFGWKLAHDWKLDAAIRYLTDSEEQDHFYTWFPSVVLRVPLSEQWNGHIEYFSAFSAQKEQDFVQHFVSGGIAFNPTLNTEIGTRLGFGLNDQSAPFFVNVGGGFRY